MQYTPYKDALVNEIWNEKIPLYSINTAWEFGKGFNVDNNKYKFEASVKNTTAVIGFTTNDDIWRKKLGNTKVFAGVFCCIEELLQTHKINTLEFSTDIVQPELRDSKKPEKGFKPTLLTFYENANFKKYMKDRFRFNLTGRKATNERVFWQYKTTLLENTTMEW